MMMLYAFMLYYISVTNTEIPPRGASRRCHIAITMPACFLRRPLMGASYSPTASRHLGLHAFDALPYRHHVSTTGQGYVLLHARLAATPSLPRALMITLLI